MNDPDQAAHLLGKLITHVGPEARSCWGTDSLWYGSPQPEIVALRRFEFTERGKELYGLPYGLEGDVEDPTRTAPTPGAHDPQRDPRPQRRARPTRSTPTQPRKAIALRRRSTGCATTATCSGAGHRARSRRRSPPTSSPAPRTRREVMKIADGEAVVAVRRRRRRRWRASLALLVAGAVRASRPTGAGPCRRSCAPTQARRRRVAHATATTCANTRHQADEKAISPGRRAAARAGVDVLDRRRPAARATSPARRSSPTAASTSATNARLGVRAQRRHRRARVEGAGALRRRHQLERVAGRAAGACTRRSRATRPRPRAARPATRASGPTSSPSTSRPARSCGRRASIDTQPGADVYGSPVFFDGTAADRRVGRLRRARRRGRPLRVPGLDGLPRRRAPARC